MTGDEFAERLETEVQKFVAMGCEHSAHYALMCLSNAIRHARKIEGPSEQTGPFMTVRVEEWQRLRDLEWWITKHGKPGLETYRDIYGVGTAAAKALAALPGVP